MIPPQKIGSLIFSEPSEGIFMVTDYGEMICRTSNPVEALRHLQDCFDTKIERYLMPMIKNEGYDMRGEKIN